MPQASEDAVFMLVIPDRTTKMAADVAQRLDLALKLVQENIVVVDPPSKLSSFLQFLKKRVIAERGLSPSCSTVITLDSIVIFYSWYS